MVSHVTLRSSSEAVPLVLTLTLAPSGRTRSRSEVVEEMTGVARAVPDKRARVRRLKMHFMVMKDWMRKWWVEFVWRIRRVVFGDEV